MHFVPIRIRRIAGQILASGYESPANDDRQPAIVSEHPNSYAFVGAQAEQNCSHQAVVTKYPHATN
jgi:hypothetical protein